MRFASPSIRGMGYIYPPRYYSNQPINRAKVIKCLNHDTILNLDSRFIHAFSNQQYWMNYSEQQLYAYLKFCRKHNHNFEYHIR